MSTDRLVVYWHGRPVGVVVDAKVDMYDFYGRWVPASAEETYTEFLRQVALDGGAWVEIGDVGSTLSGSVEIEPDHEINIKLRPKIDRSSRNADKQGDAE